MVLGAGIAGHRRSLHGSGCPRCWSKTGRPHPYGSCVALVCGTCSTAVCVRWMRRGIGLARMAAPATDVSSPDRRRDHDRSGDMGLLARFHPSQRLANSVYVSVRRIRLVVSLHCAVGARAWEYLRARRGSRQCQRTALIAESTECRGRRVCAVRRSWPGRTYLDDDAIRSRAFSVWSAAP